MNFSTCELADFAGLLEVSQEICKFAWRKMHRQMCRRINQRFLNPFSEKVFEVVLRRLAERGSGKLICYYPSEAYITWLYLMPEVEHIDTIDCQDLFNGRNGRERIEIYRIRDIILS